MPGLAAACIVALATIAGGTAATYVDRGPVPLYARIATGACIGFTLLALASLILGSFIGLTLLTAILAAIAVMSPIAIFLRPERRHQVRVDTRAAFDRARAALRGETPYALARFGLLVLLAVFLAATFRQAMIDTGDGIQTRSLANRFDLTLHLGIISGFLWGDNFPPIHPEFSAAPLTYPFLADLGAAVLVRSGATMGAALFLQSLILVVSLIALLHYWAYRLTSSHAVALLAPPLVLFGSGLGWLVMLRDAYASGDPGFLMALPRSYTLNTANLQWGNLSTIMLLPQRSLQLGLPLIVIVTTLWWRALGAAKAGEPAASSERSGPGRLMILAGVTAGLLPLAHTHSFGVALVASAGLAVLFPHGRLWARFAATVAIVAAPQLLWIARDSPVRPERFFEWAPGWSKGPEPLLWFWFKNTGVFIALLVLAFAAPRTWVTPVQRRFYLPFLLFFIIPNLFRVAPRIWDNNKVLIYWYVASVPLVALTLLRIWSHGRAWRPAAALLCASLILAGMLDAWRVAAGTVTTTVFDAGALSFASQIRERTPPRSVIARAPTVDHPVMLTGRRSFLGYASRVKLHGLDPAERERELRCIYTGCPEATAALGAHAIDYIVVGPQERAAIAVNDAFLRQFQIAAESDGYRLLRVNRQ